MDCRLFAMRKDAARDSGRLHCGTTPSLAMTDGRCCCRCRDGYFGGFGREVKSETLLPLPHPPSLLSLGLRQFIVSDMTGGFDAIKRTDDIPACNSRTGPNENLTASAPSLLQTIICYGGDRGQCFLVLLVFLHFWLAVLHFWLAVGCQRCCKL